MSEPGVFFGPLCECHEWVCETYDGSTCAGKGGGGLPRAPGAHSPQGFLPLFGESRREGAPKTALQEVTDFARVGPPNLLHSGTTCLNTFLRLRVQT